MKILKRFLIVIVACLSVAGCGYTTSSTLPTHIKSIHVGTFDNKISFTTESRRNLYLPLLEIDVRNAIVDRFLFDGNLKIAESDDSDLYLQGELLNYRRVGLRFTDNDDVEEYRVYITVRLEMLNNSTQEVMWEETSFIGEATYFVTGPNVSSEEDAVKEAIQDLARRIVERTVEDW